VIEFPKFELPKSMRRMMRRFARDVTALTITPATREAMRSIGELVQSQLDGLPPTTFRCVCGRYVASYELVSDGRAFSPRNKGDVLAHQLECKEHGPLEDFSPADWRAEWTRRGQPSSFTWRLRPLS